jgi:transposase InsO family protein
VASGELRPVQAIFAGRRHRAAAPSGAGLRQLRDRVQSETAPAATVAAEIEDFLTTFNEVRPHQSLGQRIPFVMHRGDPHLFRG